MKKRQLFCRKRGFGKKALSPIISSIILICLGIVIAILIFYSSVNVLQKSYEREASHINVVGVDMPSRQACEEINFDADIIIDELGKNKLDVSNLGDVPIYGFKIKKIQIGATSVEEINNTNLNAGLSDSFDIGNLTGYTRTTILPIILSTSADGKSQIKYTCSEEYGKIITLQEEILTGPIGSLLTINIISPQGTYPIGTTSTNFTISTNLSASWCGYSLDNSANITMTLNSSKTGANATNSSMTQGSHSVVFYCNDTNGKFATNSAIFIIGSVSLTVALQSPADSSTTSNNVLFSCNATGNSLKNMSLYGNWSSTWSLNETQNITGIYNSTSFTKILSNGAYKWNCLACNTSNSCAWAPANYSFNVNSSSPPSNIDVYDCRELNQSNTVYLLKNDVAPGIINACFNITANNVTLDCQGKGIISGSSQVNYAIYSGSVSYTTIKNCNISLYYGTASCIYFFNSSYGIIKNNTISKCYYGLFLTGTITSCPGSCVYHGEHTDNNLISNNNIHHNYGEGIHAEFSSYNNLTNNEVSYNTQNGINIRPASTFTFESSNNLLINNNVNNNSQGGIVLNLKTSTSGIPPCMSNNMLINNTANYNQQDGIRLLKAASTYLCKNNTLINNTANYNTNRGISLFYTSNNTLLNNNASYNKYGLHLSYSSNNTLISNNAINNSYASGTSMGIYLDNSNFSTFINTVSCSLAADYDFLCSSSTGNSFSGSKCSSSVGGCTGLTCSSCP
jgi:parallel beta-helix repeat protein